MKVSDAETITIGYEGLRLQRYKDSRGSDTIGYGHRCRPDDHRQTITQAEAYAQFSRDYHHAFSCAYLLLRGEVGYGGGVPEAFEAGWRKGELDSRSAALIDLVFNMGDKKLGSFVGMWAAWKAGDWNRAAAELLYTDPDQVLVDGPNGPDPGRTLTPYARQVGRRAAENAWRLLHNTEPGRAA